MNKKIIEKLKDASKAYQLACEYDYCPSEGNDGYIPEVDYYSGERPDEIANAIIRLIDKLEV